MGTRDPRVDAYIAKQAEFARPILEYIREAVHAGCPEVEETLKWSAPHFMHHGMMCGMAAFRQHCAFGFWKGRLVVDTGDEKLASAMGQFGTIRTLKDLPSKRALVGYVKKAAKLNEEGIKAPRAQKARKQPLATPPDLAAALKKNRKAAATFEAFPPSHRREYVEWITEAKREETRQRRLEQAVEWMAEGKHRNWKYMTR
jgi:uncharacterized protein YdeI (YjbR/CyaY-like superfamily)